MTASVVSSWGPGFVVGARRPVRYAGRPKAAAGSVGVAPPMRRRFQVEVPDAPAPAPPAPPVSRRARRVEHPAPGQVRVGRQVKRSRARSAARRGRAVSSGIRLTRRGRILLLVLAAVAVYAAFGLGRASAGGAAAPAQASTVVVHSGDSLWSIASRAFPNSDPRDVVGELKSLNHLSSSDLAVGQTLRLP